MSGAVVRLAAWQGWCGDGDIDGNLEAAHRAIGEAGEKGVDFLCLPETFLSGYGSREVVERGAMVVDDPRLAGLGREAGERGMVLLVGFAERMEDGRIGNTVAIFSERALLGTYRKTMLTGSDAREMGFCRDYDLPVWQAKGITFGCIVCHDSSFVEPAAVMAYKGAQVLFSPHYNSIAVDGMDAHRIRVRNNHVGLATLLGMYVVRANVIGFRAPADGKPARLGYGDSAIFDPNGVAVAEAGLFKEGLIVADADTGMTRGGAARRDELPDRVRQQLADALSGYRRVDERRAPPTDRATH